MTRLAELPTQSASPKLVPCRPISTQFQDHFSRPRVRILYVKVLHDVSNCFRQRSVYIEACWSNSASKYDDSGAGREGTVPFGVLCSRQKEVGGKIDGLRIFLKQCFSIWN